jgi:hypothetical protein
MRPSALRNKPCTLTAQCVTWLVCIWQYVAIISRNRCFCAVVTQCLLRGRNWYLNTVQRNLMCGVDCAVRRLFAGLSPRGAEFDPRSDWVRFLVEKVALEKGFSLSTSVFPCHYNSTNAPSPSSSYCYKKDKREKPMNLPKTNALV